MDAEAGGLERRSAQRARPELLHLHWRPYRFALPRALVTSQGAWSQRRGWLLKLEATDGSAGWGEAVMAPAPDAALNPHRLHGGAARSGGSPGGAVASSGGPVALAASGGGPDGRGDEAGALDLTAAVQALPASLQRQELEASLPTLPAPLACALGMALAELDGLGSTTQGGWRAAPPSALLLPAGDAVLTALEQALAAAERAGSASSATGRSDPQANGTARQNHRPGGGLTVKWKVASGTDALEQRLLTTLLERLPRNGRLRLDANGGWDRSTAWRWAERLAGEPRLDWLEQPLAPDDQDGLEALARMLPVALDESLRLDPALLTGGWPGWQVRRPLVEADPRPLLEALLAGTPRVMLSTALETGIGRRFLEHLAGLQALGPTPTAPGLAPGWRPRGGLFSRDPETVWRAAG